MSWFVTIKRGPANKSAMRRLRKMPQSTRTGIRRAMHKAGKLITDTAIKKIRDKNKTGRTYKIRGRKHRASALGEAPARLTGALIGSIDHQVENRGVDLEVGAGKRYNQGSTLGRKAGEAYKYARRLELQMNRPYIKPSVEEWLAHIDRMIEREVVKTIKQQK